MSAHRYWRLHVGATGGDGAVAIGELRLAIVPGGAQAATGGTASASSTNGANAASNAFDGVTSSGNFWQSLSALPAYVQYDMGVDNGIDVVEIRIYFTTTPGATTFPANIVLCYSDNGVIWYPQRAWGGLTFSNAETKTLGAAALPSQDIKNREEFIRTYRYNAAANVGAPLTRRVLPRLAGTVGNHTSLAAMSTPWSGNYYVAGSTTVLGIPAARRVNLVDQASGILVRSIPTQADGYFRFDQVGLGPWTVIGVDPRAEQNSVIYAHVVPALMT